MNRLLLRSLAHVLLVAALLAPGACSRTEKKEEEEEHFTAPVKVVQATRQEMGEYTELLGATQTLPGHAARVTSSVQGNVLWVLSDGKKSSVVEGQHVKKGDVIVQLDDRIVKANRAKTAALLEELREQKAQAEVAVDLVKLDRDRLQSLVPGGNGGNIPLVSKLEMDKVRLSLRDAESKLKAITAREESIKSDLQALDVQLEFYQLRAPIDGHLGTVQAAPGEPLGVGTAVTEVIDLSEIDVVCPVTPEAAARLKIGQPAWIKTEHDEGEPESGIAGKVVYIAVQAQADTGNFLVKLRFKNPEQKLLANMVTRVRVLTQEKKMRWVVPEAAVMEDEADPIVVVAENFKKEKNEEGEEEEKGEAHRYKAVLGARDPDHHLVEIVSLEDTRENKEDSDKKDNDKKKTESPEGKLFIVEGAHGLEDKDAVKKEEEKEEKKDEKDAKKEEKEEK